MKITRKVTFCSGHRYWLEGLPEEENRRRFGRWASPYNHGHNYELEATVAGRVETATGMLMNISTLDDIMRERVSTKFDQKSINDEIPEFKNVPPSLELLALFMWKQLLSLPQGVRLHKVRLSETPNLWAEVIQRSGSLDVNLTRVYEFCASHRLHVPTLSESANQAIFGKCNNPSGHGHNYTLEVTVSGQIDQESGMVADIEMIDNIVNQEVIERYDHKYLNVDVPEFASTNPTSEMIAKVIWQRLNGKLPAKLERVVLRETRRNIFEYCGEDE